jgi:hemolysin activation/secretion protein
MQFGDIPFYSTSVLPFTDGDKTGLGGFDTIRGFNDKRFIGEAATFANMELRWSFAETFFLKQHLRFMLVPFADAGRVFDSISRTTLRDYKYSGGLGFRLAWNVSTIVSFDYSYSSDDNYSLNMELGHQF